MRLMEGAQQVLAALQVHARFSAHCGVHLGQQRRRDLNNRYAPHENRRQKTAHVAADTAAESHHDARPIRAPGQHLVGQGFQHGQALVRLPAREVQNL